MKNILIQNPKVSIILPIYNVEPYLRECLNSVLNQTYKNIEIILVDDGSPDNCGKICDEFSEIDERVIVIHKKNEGVSRARNDGLKYATGEYICFADPDDILSIDYIEYLLNLLISNNADISLTTTYFLSNDENQNRKIDVEIISGVDCFINILLHKMPIGVYCKLFKTSLIRDNNIKFFEDIYIGEGFNFNSCCFQQAKKIVTSSKKIYFYRMDNPNSAVTLFNSDKWLNALYALDKIEKKSMFKNNDEVKNAIDFAKWYDCVFIIKKMYNENVLKENVFLKNKCLKDIDRYYKAALLVDVSIKTKIRAILYRFSKRFIYIDCVLYNFLKKREKAA